MQLGQWTLINEDDDDDDDDNVETLLLLILLSLFSIIISLLIVLFSLFRSCCCCFRFNDALDGGGVVLISIISIILTNDGIWGLGWGVGLMRCDVMWLCAAFYMNLKQGWGMKRRWWVVRIFIVQYQMFTLLCVILLYQDEFGGLFIVFVLVLVETREYIYICRNHSNLLDFFFFLIQKKKLEYGIFIY